MPRWDSVFLRFAQDFGRRLRRRLNASISLAMLAQNDTLKHSMSRVPRFTTGQPA
jgi:hypothetical protein